MSRSARSNLRVLRTRYASSICSSNPPSFPKGSGSTPRWSARKHYAHRASRMLSRATSLPGSIRCTTPGAQHAITTTVWSFRPPRLLRTRASRRGSSRRGATRHPRAVRRGRRLLRSSIVRRRSRSRAPAPRGTGAFPVASTRRRPALGRRATCLTAATPSAHRPARPPFAEPRTAASSRLATGCSSVPQTDFEQREPETGLRPAETQQSNEGEAAGMVIGDVAMAVVGEVPV